MRLRSKLSNRSLSSVKHKENKTKPPSRARSMKRRARSIGIAPVLGEWRMALAERIFERRLAVLYFPNRNQRAWTALIISSERPPPAPEFFFYSLHTILRLLLLLLTGITFCCQIHARMFPPTSRPLWRRIRR